MSAKRKWSPSEALDRYQIPIVTSTFKILKELSTAGSLNLNEMTQRTNVSKSSVFRILNTLQSLGYVTRDAILRTYHLTNALADLANDEGGSEALRRMALPHMIQLRDQFGETVNLGLLDFDKVTYIEVVPSEYALRLSERPGATVPVHASAIGKCILAYTAAEKVRSIVGSRELPALTPNTIVEAVELFRELQRVRSRGYAFDKQETMLMANCVGAPILDARGNALAGMSISGPSSRFNPRDSAVVDKLLKAVAAISEQVREPPGGPALAGIAQPKRVNRSLNGSAPGKNAAAARERSATKRRATRE